MIGPLDQIRLVEDRGRVDGAVVTDQVLEVGAESAFPLQAALGYDLSQHLFIGDANLLVEGSSDFVYIDVMSRFLRESGREGIDASWRVLPAGGASNVPAFVTLLGAKLSVTVLVDSGTEGLGRVHAAIESGKLRSDRLVTIGEVIGSRHADIEDLFSPGDYLTLYNAAYGKTHKVTDLQSGIDRIVKRLEQIDGKFDHWLPAQELLRSTDKRLRGLSATTLDNFENLARRINRTL